MIRISQIKLTPVADESRQELKSRLTKKAARMLGIKGNIKLKKIVKYSIDARKSDNVLCIYTADFECDNEALLIKKSKSANVRLCTDKGYNPLIASPVLKEHKKIVVVGAGPCGLFAAYMLALNGFKPTLIERGKSVEERKKDVEQFWNGKELKLKSNVQFGEGGAGTFSDGKLNTQVKDPSGRIAFVLDTFVRHGANEEITYHYRPHVGTDVLENIVRSMRNEIIALGGSVRFECCMTDIEQKDGCVKGIRLENDELIEADAVVLAIGHSARDTFRMLKNNKLKMLSKDFAVGYRVQHPQDFINKSQYGEQFMNMFPAAPYKLKAAAGDDRGVYSFCMCPGGYVVNASSEENRLCVNGMSYSDRASGNANSAIVMQVGRLDYKNTLDEKGAAYDAEDPLLGVYFQEILEENAYKCANGKIPVQLLGDFKKNTASAAYGRVEPRNKGITHLANLRGILPEALEKAFLDGMAAFGKSIKGFDDDDTIICAIESRTSSPVRIERDECGVSSIDGVYPAGEGAGYAGGITSAAVDGIITAEKIIRRFDK